MYKLFKKVPKNPEKLRGSKEIEEGENPFESPCLLCLSAQDMDKQVFGITKNYMAMAGLRIRNNPSGKFNLDGFPVNFLSIKKQRDDDTEEECADKLVDTYFMPLLTECKTKEDVMKKFRNINIMSYCNGTKRAVDIINNLKGKILERGYSKEDIKAILSQISLITLSTDINYRNLGTTCVDFHDFRDGEVSIEDTSWVEKMEELVKIENSNEYEGLLIDKENQTALYCIEGSGCHSVKQFLYEGKAMPVCLTKILHNVLENSIQNSKSDKLKPITAFEMVNGCQQIFEEANKGKTPEELRTDLYKNMQYTDSTRLTDKECELLDRLDESYDLIRKQNLNIEKSENQISDFEAKQEKIAQTIKENSSEITYNKFLLATGWQFPNEEKVKIEEADSDREIIEKQESKINKLQSMLEHTLSFAEKVRESRFGRFFFRKELKQLPEGRDEEK